MPKKTNLSATSVVDVRSLRSQDDIKKDEFGIWNYSGSHPLPFEVHEKDNDHLIVGWCCPGVSEKNVELLRQHPSFEC